MTRICQLQQESLIANHSPAFCQPDHRREEQAVGPRLQQGISCVNPDTTSSALRGRRAPSPRMRCQRIGSLEPMVSAWAGIQGCVDRVRGSTCQPFLGTWILLANVNISRVFKRGAPPASCRGRVRQAVIYFLGQNKSLIETIRARWFQRGGKATSFSPRPTARQQGMAR